VRYLHATAVADVQTDLDAPTEPYILPNFNALADGDSLPDAAAVLGGR
jgi:hypothetical protein